jgi:hypothetical protein
MSKSLAEIIEEVKTTEYDPKEGELVLYLCADY